MLAPEGEKIVGEFGIVPGFRTVPMAQLTVGGKTQIWMIRSLRGIKILGMTGIAVRGKAGKLSVNVAG